MQQLGGALRHIHSLGVAHRDVKPENILFMDSSYAQIKLADFGFASQCGTKKLKDVCGTPLYMAPELFRGVAYRGPPVDCWACGCVFYELWQRRQCFEQARDMGQLQLLVAKAKLSEPISKRVPVAVRHAIMGLLEPESAKRWTAQEVLTKVWPDFETLETTGEHCADPQPPLSVACGANQALGGGVHSIQPAQPGSDDLPTDITCSALANT